jgi:hypothetical protein
MPGPAFRAAAKNFSLNACHGCPPVAMTFYLERDDF